MREFDHERMEVYQWALDFVGTASVIRETLLRRRAALADQLDRAAVSIALNIAEGAGEFARREKARFYRIARRSATECAAILDVARELHLAEEDSVRSGKEQLQAIVGSLIGLGKKMEREAALASPLLVPSEA
jgi:four helix bundle protein